MAKSEQIKANKPGQSGGSEGASIDQRTQGYIDGVIDVKKGEIKQELTEELKKEIDSTAEKIKKDFQDTINQNQTRVIEALAVFVALFTFISINIQIFSRVENLMSASIFMIFMAFLTMIIVSFPLVLLRVLRNDPAPKWVWWILLISIILLISAFLFSLWINIPLNQIKN
jgi:hypothetical protein